MSGSFFGWLMFACKFTVFSESRLWEYRISSFKKACLAQMSRVFLWIFHLFLLLEALQGFGRYCQALGSFGWLWMVLSTLQSFVRLSEALLGSLERLRKALVCFMT